MENNRVIHGLYQEGYILDVSVYKGEGLKTPLNQPQGIDASGARAVVMDWGNQRIVKLSLQKETVRSKTKTV